MSDLSVEAFLGKTAESIEQNGDEEVIFTFGDGSRFKMFHRADCCEHVWLADVTGAWDTLIGRPLLMAEMETADGSDEEDCSESRTWTFYKFATVKGYVTLRWCGESNGYYSESVDIVRLTVAPADVVKAWSALAETVASLHPGAQRDAYSPGYGIVNYSAPVKGRHRTQFVQVNSRDSDAVIWDVATPTDLAGAMALLSALAFAIKIEVSK